MELVRISVEGLLAAIDKFCLPYEQGAFSGTACQRMTGYHIDQYSVDQDSVIETCDGNFKKIKDFSVGDKVWGVDSDDRIIETSVVNLHDHGELPGFEATFDDGYTIVCSAVHKFLTPEGMSPLHNIVSEGLEVCCAGAESVGLVLRRIVRVRYVGERHMYDLEVSHPKHNFLLPNGVVTSNSETLLHFYPSDRRKLYRANKIIGRQSSPDFEVLSAKVNEAVPGTTTTASEIADLVAAASCVSTDAVPVPEHDGEHHENPVDRYAADESVRPDVQVETADVMIHLYKAYDSLTTFERKLLRLKGLTL
jgi:hypothetical protein